MTGGHGFCVQRAMIRTRSLNCIKTDTQPMTARLLSLTVLFLLCTALRSEHYLGATITTHCTGGNFHEITLQVFRNCTGTVLGPQTLHFTNDCGVQFDQQLSTPSITTDVSPLCAAQLPNSSCNGGSLLGIELATFTITAYLSPCTNWRITWDICCRNTSLNVVSAPGMYVETLLNNANGTCGSSPVFDQDIIPTVCSGQSVSHYASATGDPSHRLSYHLIDARFASPAPSPLIYASGYSGTLPFTSMAIDTVSGEITFEATTTGSIITAVEVREFDGDALIGTVMRDFVFIVTNCSNTPPPSTTGTFVSADGVASVAGDRTLRACGEGSFCATLNFTDVDAGQTLELTSDIEAQLPGATMLTTGTNPLQATICWNAAGLGLGSYPFSIRAMDGACPIPASRLYHYTIQVETAPTAGSDANAQICENGNEVQLITLLGGTPEMGGTWLDPQNAASSGVFMPGGSSAGGYTYTVTGPTGCTDQSMVTVELLSASTTECLNADIEVHGLNSFHLFVEDNHGRVTITGTSGLDLELRLFGLDGRELWNGSALLNNGSSTVNFREHEVHGLCILGVRDRRTGDERALRVLLP